MSITINPPPGPWTVADLDDLPDVGSRAEIHEGKLVLMAPVKLWHSRIMVRIKLALASRGLAADIEIGVKRSVKSMRIADVAVFHQPPTDMDQAYWHPDQLALVVEVVSESSEEDDRVAKPRWYAAAGIDEFWRVERSEDAQDAVIFQYKLATTVDGESAYVQTGVTTLSALETPYGSNL
jgi:Uma2 family endonuclease